MALAPTNADTSNPCLKLCFVNCFSVWFLLVNADVWLKSDPSNYVNLFYLFLSFVIVFLEIFLFVKYTIFFFFSHFVSIFLLPVVLPSSSFCILDELLRVLNGIVN
jgi:hypothetical protein